jgi:hypothetical protein
MDGLYQRQLLIRDKLQSVSTVMLYFYAVLIHFRIYKFITANYYERCNQLAAILQLHNVLDLQSTAGYKPLPSDLY